MMSKIEAQQDRTIARLRDAIDKKKRQIALRGQSTREQLRTKEKYLKTTETKIANYKNSNAQLNKQLKGAGGQAAHLKKGIEEREQRIEVMKREIRTMQTAERVQGKQLKQLARDKHQWPKKLHTLGEDVRVLEQRLSKLGKRILALSTNQKKEMMKKERLIAENEKLKKELDDLGHGERMLKHQQRSSEEQARMERTRTRLRNEVKMLEEKLQKDRVLVEKKIMGGRKRIQRLKQQVAKIEVKASANKNEEALLLHEVKRLKKQLKKKGIEPDAVLRAEPDGPEQSLSADDFGNNGEESIDASNASASGQLGCEIDGSSSEGSDWVKQYHNGKKKFFWQNQKTGETLWNAPPGWHDENPASESVDDAPNADAEEPVSGEKVERRDEESAHNAEVSVGETTTESVNEWMKQYHSGKKKFFWKNQSTGETLWIAPPGWQDEDATDTNEFESEKSAECDAEGSVSKVATEGTTAQDSSSPRSAKEDVVEAEGGAPESIEAADDAKTTEVETKTESETPRTIENVKSEESEVAGAGDETVSEHVDNNGGADNKDDVDVDGKTVKAAEPDEHAATGTEEGSSSTQQVNQNDDNASASEASFDDDDDSDEKKSANEASEKAVTDQPKEDTSAPEAHSGEEKAVVSNASSNDDTESASGDGQTGDNEDDTVTNASARKDAGSTRNVDQNDDNASASEASFDAESNASQNANKESALGDGHTGDNEDDMVTEASPVTDSSINNALETADEDTATNGVDATDTENHGVDTVKGSAPLDKGQVDGPNGKGEDSLGEESFDHDGSEADAPVDAVPEANTTEDGNADKGASPTTPTADAGDARSDNDVAAGNDRTSGHGVSDDEDSSEHDFF